MMAKLDASPTGYKKVADSTPAWSPTFFRGDWSRNIFTVILSLQLIQKGQLSISGERICTILVNSLSLGPTELATAMRPICD